MTLDDWALCLGYVVMVGGGIGITIFIWMWTFDLLLLLLDMKYRFLRWCWMELHHNDDAG